MREKTSIIIPCYNCNDVIGDTLDSLFNQTEKADEIILIDDGSSDNTFEVINKYKDRVKIITQENSGAAAARHKGTLHAKNDIIIYMDSGDIAPKNKVKSLKNALIENPSCICSFGGYWNKARAKPVVSHFDKLPFSGKHTVIEDPFALLLGNSFPATLAMNIAVRRDLAIKAKISSRYKAGNDNAFQLSLARFGKFVYVSEITIEFDVLDNGISDSYGIDQQMAYSLFAAVEFYNKHPNKEKYKKIFKRRVSNYWPEIALYLHITSKKELFWKIIMIGIKHGAPYQSLKAFKWAIEKTGNKSQLNNNKVLKLIHRIIP